MNIYTRQCLVCGTGFTQPGKRGTLRRMCSEACSQQRIRDRKNQRVMSRYNALRNAGADRDFAFWGATGQVRFEATLEVLTEKTVPTR